MISILTTQTQLTR